MDRDGKLRLELVDVYGKGLAEKVDIDLTNQDLTDHQLVRSADASKRLLIPNLYGAPRGIYRLEIDPPSYLPVSRFVNLPAGGFADLTIRFPVDPKKVVRAEFPAYEALHQDARRLIERSKQVRGFELKSGPDLYNSVDDLRRAGMLNILAKSGRTRFANGSTVLSYLQGLTELRQDRFFVTAQAELRDEVKNSVAAGLFGPVSGALHTPPQGYTAAGSFKTDDQYGNLQVTFFAGPDSLLADIDIDDAAGLEHVFQVLRNTLSGRPTHPYDIHEILIAHQELDPGYRLITRAEPTRRTAST